ncbi:hypothetical protein DENSPDRAFT_834494 [Dentipellis sp. KUC8613]|nr:hypothetical protein DENSPDRAFT_834494 [Dentipellis sp. KUC8613]
MPVIVSSTVDYFLSAPPRQPTVSLQSGMESRYLQAPPTPFRTSSYSQHCTAVTPQESSSENSPPVLRAIVQDALAEARRSLPPSLQEARSRPCSLS